MHKPPRTAPINGSTPLSALCLHFSRGVLAKGKRRICGKVVPDPVKGYISGLNQIAMNYRPANFPLKELVDPSFLKLPEDQVWDMLDEQALRALQALRERFGRIVVNGVYKGHTFTESGLRTKTTKTGAKTSQHKLGKAFDLKFLDTDEIKVYDFLINSPEKAYAMGIRRLENIEFTGRAGDAGWLHFDTKDTGPEWMNRIQIVNP